MCYHASRVISPTVLDPVTYVTDHPCDVNLYIIDEDYTLKIVAFEEYLMNMSHKVATNRFYKLDCKCERCKGFNYGHALLWTLKSLDISDDEQKAMFDNIFDYIKNKYPYFTEIIGGGNNPPPQTVSFMVFYGPVISTPATSNDVLALNSSANTGSFTLATGTSYTKFSVVLPPGKSISQVLDTTTPGFSLKDQYTYLGTIGVVNPDGNTYQHELYENNITIQYSTSHDHEVTFV